MLMQRQTERRKSVVGNACSGRPAFAGAFSLAAFGHSFTTPARGGGKTA